MVQKQRKVLVLPFQKVNPSHGKTQTNKKIIYTTLLAKVAKIMFNDI
jgi:hypothetical protein